MSVLNISSAEVLAVSRTCGRYSKYLSDGVEHAEPKNLLGQHLGNHTVYGAEVVATTEAHNEVLTAACTALERLSGVLSWDKDALRRAAFELVEADRAGAGQLLGPGTPSYH